MTPLKVKGYYGTSDGRVFSWFCGQWLELKQGTNRSGYKTVRLKRKLYSVHRLIAEAFISTPDLVINHIDGDRLNNHSSNLEWVTQSENLYHAHRVLKIGSPKGVRNHSAKLDDNLVKEVYHSVGTYKELGKKYGVQPSTISKIKNRQSWTHVEMGEE